MWPQFRQDISPSTMLVLMRSVCRSFRIIMSSSDRSSLVNSGLLEGRLEFPRSVATLTTALQSTRSMILSKNSGLNSKLSSCSSWHFSPLYLRGKLSLLLSHSLTEHLRKLEVRNFIGRRVMQIDTLAW